MSKIAFLNLLQFPETSLVFLLQTAFVFFFTMNFVINGEFQTLIDI